MIAVIDQIEVTSLAKGVGFSLPVLVSSAVHFKAIEAHSPDVQLGRMVSMLRHAWAAIYRERGGRVDFLYGGCMLSLVLQAGVDFKPFISIILKGEFEYDT